MVLEIKFIKGKNFNEKQEYINLKSWPKNFEKIHKNREKILQFFGVNDLKIQWTVFELKFIKGKKFNEKWKYVNLKNWPKIFEKIQKNREKICNFLV